MEKSSLFIFQNDKLTPPEQTALDQFASDLISQEFAEVKIPENKDICELMDLLGFIWDPLAKKGYLDFQSYATVMFEAVKHNTWEMVHTFCLNAEFPVQRISGGDIYSMNNPLIQKHVELAEAVGMYGEGLLKVGDDQILRFSGCSNKLSLLRTVNFDKFSLPFGIFEISDSYRYEKEDELNLLARNRMFHLPELHIINRDIESGLRMMLVAHSEICRELAEYGFETIMLFTTTSDFVARFPEFIKQISKNASHSPVHQFPRF